MSNFHLKALYNQYVRFLFHYGLAYGQWGLNNSRHASLIIHEISFQQKLSSVVRILDRLKTSASFSHQLSLQDEFLVNSLELDLIKIHIYYVSKVSLKYEFSNDVLGILDWTLCHITFLTFLWSMNSLCATSEFGQKILPHSLHL